MSVTLEQQLVEMARRLDVDVDDRLVDDVLARLDDDSVTTLRSVSRRRPLAIAGMLAAAALTIVFALPSPRRTVAHWFGAPKWATGLRSVPSCAPIRQRPCGWRLSSAVIQRRRTTLFRTRL